MYLYILSTWDRQRARTPHGLSNAVMISDRPQVFRYGQVHRAREALRRAAERQFSPVRRHGGDSTRSRRARGRARRAGEPGKLHRCVVRDDPWVVVYQYVSRGMNSTESLNPTIINDKSTASWTCRSGWRRRPKHTEERRRGAGRNSL